MIDPVSSISYITSDTFLLVAIQKKKLGQTFAEQPVYQVLKVKYCVTTYPRSVVITLPVEQREEKVIRQKTKEMNWSVK